MNLFDYLWQLLSPKAEFTNRKSKPIQLARNLARHVPIADDKTPIQGLNILIHGWLKYRKYGKKYYFAIHNRDFLFISEVHDLSTYAGYDLSKMES